MFVELPFLSRQRSVLIDLTGHLDWLNILIVDYRWIPGRKSCWTAPVIVNFTPSTIPLQVDPFLFYTHCHSFFLRILPLLCLQSQVPNIGAKPKPQIRQPAQFFQPSNCSNPQSQLHFMFR
jgi:hypothetical protein